MPWLWQVMAEEQLLQGLSEKSSVIQRALAQACENASIMCQASILLPCSKVGCTETLLVCKIDSTMCATRMLLRALSKEIMN